MCVLRFCVWDRSTEACLNPPVIFLDDGDVMNDNQPRAQQWQRLVAEYFVPILGGTRSAWAEANRVMLDDMLAPPAWQARMAADADYQAFDDHYQLDWLKNMCSM